MPYFRFFKKDENCRWLRKEILEHYPEYLYGPVDHEGKPVRFHVILDWVMRENRGANAQWVKEIGGNVVQSAKDVPAGDGVFITGYDCDIEERRDLENRGVPIVDRACPWVKEFRDQLLALDPSTHQAVVMIDEGHMVYQCYRSIIPADAILVQPEDFRERIERLHDGKRALTLIVYTVYRPKDAERVILYIEENRANGANDLRGYEKTLCVWTKQGLFEEMAALIPAERLGEVSARATRTGPLDPSSTRSPTRAPFPGSSGRNPKSPAPRSTTRASESSWPRSPCPRKRSRSRKRSGSVSAENSAESLIGPATRGDALTASRARG
jgi:hypothetical protein